MLPKTFFSKRKDWKAAKIAKRYMMMFDFFAPLRGLCLFALKWGEASPPGGIRWEIGTPVARRLPHARDVSHRRDFLA